MNVGNVASGIGLVVVCGGLMVSGCRKPEARLEAELEEAGYGTEPEDFHRAAEIGDLAVMERMLEAGIALDVAAGMGDTALHAAAAAGSVAAMELLMERGLSVDVRGAANRTPLMAAAAENEAEACAALLQEGAKPELSDNNGYRAITVAADRGNVAAIRSLAVHSRDYLDDALLLACLRGNGEAAGVLADYGASVYARMDDGMTPLMLAAREGHTETVRVLLEQGANRYAVDAEGRTAGQLAADAKHEVLAEVLNRDPGMDAFSLAEVPELMTMEMEAMEDIGGEEPGMEEEGAVAGAVVGAIIGHQGGEPLEGAVIGAALEEPVGEGADMERAGEPLVGRPVPDVGRPVREEGIQPPVEPAVAGVVDGQPKQEELEDWEKEMLSGGAAVPIADLEREDVSGADAVQTIEKTLVMETYREKPLPLRVEGVHGDEVRVRYLYGENKSVTVKTGEEIPFTGLRVVKVEQRYDDTKMSLGQPMDVSTVVVEDPASGRQRELVAKLGASAHEPFAVLRPRAGGEPMVVTRGGVLRVPSGAMFVVLDVRPSQVVLENAATGEVHTVNSGSVNP